VSSSITAPLDRIGVDFRTKSEAMMSVSATEKAERIHMIRPAKTSSMLLSKKPPLTPCRKCVEYL
jgi:hypothetical protein